MDLGAPFRLAHALARLSFVAGLVGLRIVTGIARRADTLATLRLLLRVTAPFGRLVSASGIGMAVLGLGTAIATARPLLGPLQGDGWIWMFVSLLLMLPIFAFLVIGVLALMIAKPF